MFSATIPAVALLEQLLVPAMSIRAPERYAAEANDISDFPFALFGSKTIQLGFAHGPAMFNDVVTIT